ncbi:hypothetical protein ACFLU5_16935 [Bacteroidota bacterium]
MEDTLKNRITIRLTDKQLAILEQLKSKAMPAYSRSEIVRILLEKIHARLEKESAEMM